MPKRRNIKVARRPDLTITRQAFKHKKLVYVTVANKPHKYPWGRTPIVYIGTTKKGAKRIAESAAFKADAMLLNHGVKKLDIYVVSCTALQAVQTWKKLESALLITFKREYGRVPLGNKVGKNQHYTDELDYFTENRLRRVLTDLGSKPT